jgi:hypothetical protein
MTVRELRRCWRMLAVRMSAGNKDAGREDTSREKMEPEGACREKVLAVRLLVVTM